MEGVEKVFFFEKEIREHLKNFVYLAANIFDYLLNASKIWNVYRSYLLPLYSCWAVIQI